MDKTTPFLIYYTLSEGHGLIRKAHVIMRIDWLRRNRLMRLHFTCELILVLLNRLFKYSWKADRVYHHPASVADINALKVMEIDLTPGSAIYGDKAYTDIYKVFFVSG